jgi:hypothetical protein
MSQPEHHQLMTDLCKRIHAVANCDGVEPWDQHKFAAAQTGRSAGEKIAASFVLTAWSGGTHQEWSGLQDFDFVEAVTRCDSSIREVIADFVRDPQWA